MQMKKSESTHKVAVDMTPMIDCVFQLMIFFMLTLKIRAEEGDFDINMPIAGAGNAPPPVVQDIKVRLDAHPDGTLAALRVGSRNLGVGPDAYHRLNALIRDAIGRPGSPQAKEQEVELDPAYNLNYQEIVRAIDACSGRAQRGPDGQPQVVRYVEKIRFAQPKPPAAAPAP